MLINVAISILGGIILSFQADGFMQALGLAFLSGSLITIIIGLFVLLIKDKNIAQGFLMSGGILLLLGIFTCSSLK